MNMQKIFFLREGTEKNVKEAFRYFIISKDQGYEKSVNFLKAYMMLNKINDFSKLPEETQLLLITNNSKELSISNSDFNRIYIKPSKAEMLFFNKSLKSQVFHM